MQPSAEADQRAGGAVGVADPVEQATPAAQRPGLGEVADRLLYERAQPCLELVVGVFVLGEPVLGASFADLGVPVLAVLAIPRKPRSTRAATAVVSSTSRSPDSSSSSCSWQLPGQPPSHYSRSPWTVVTDRPWAVCSCRLVWTATQRRRGQRSPAAEPAPPAPGQQRVQIPAQEVVARTVTAAASHAAIGSPRPRFPPSAGRHPEVRDPAPYRLPRPPGRPRP
jgi:hypothetical protein